MRSDFHVSAGRAELAAEVDGDGPLLVCLHAGVCDRRMWAPLCHELCSSFRLVAYDRRGFGETLAVDEARSQVDDLLAVLDHVAGPGAAKPPILVGCSQGGRIAIDTALQAPERVRALVLVAPAVSGAPDPDSFPAPIASIVTELEAAEQSGDLDRLNALEARLWLDGALGADGRITGDLRQLVLDMNRIALHAPAMPSLRQPPEALARLEQIAVPTLVLWGDLDFPHLQQRCAEIVRRVPGAVGQVIEGTGHLPTMEQPARCAAVIRAFADKHIH
jgi:pimeloyl-ACP methyl ester carboxylesterase